MATKSSTNDSKSDIDDITNCWSMTWLISSLRTSFGDTIAAYGQLQRKAATETAKRSLGSIGGGINVLLEDYTELSCQAVVATLWLAKEIIVADPLLIGFQVL
jgi:hypothetical protein